MMMVRKYPEARMVRSISTTLKSFVRRPPQGWFVRNVDDQNAMNLIAVSTAMDTGGGERWPAFDQHEMVAATLVQHPRYVDCADGRWDENASFIAMARQEVPRLVQEVRRLRRIIEDETASSEDK